MNPLCKCLGMAIGLETLKTCLQIQVPISLSQGPFRPPEHMHCAEHEIADNWYSSKIMPKLFDSSSSAGNWRHLQVFESGDAADRESWDMAVEYVRHLGAEWRVEREGVFVKRQPGEDENDGDDERHFSTMGALHAHNDAEEMEAGLSSDADGADEPGPVFS